MPYNPMDTNLISLAEAVQIALQQVNGTVVKTELNT